MDSRIKLREFLINNIDLIEMSQMAANLSKKAIQKIRMGDRMGLLNKLPIKQGMILPGAMGGKSTSALMTATQKAKEALAKSKKLATVGA
jgi:hypothetical protein